MEELNINQTQLARRVGVSQSAIAKIVKNDPGGSAHLHRIARELGTTPAYLAGEIDDPDANAPPPQPAPTTFHVLMRVELPPERILTRMFEVLLAGIDPALPQDAQAQLLAQRLPIGLSQLRDVRPDPPRTEDHAVLEAVGADRATSDRAPLR